MSSRVEQVHWQPMTGPFGARCAPNLDVLTIPPAVINQALAKYQLLIFPRQQLPPAAFEQFAASLGQLAQYPYAEPLPGFQFVVPIVKEPTDLHNFGGAWHTDTSYLDAPPAATLLLARELPASGGDTLFADMYGAYAALSPGLRRTLKGLEAINTSSLVHDAHGSYASVAGDVGGAGGQPQSSAQHPVVRKHPVTGRAALYVSLVHTDRFATMTRVESLPLLQYLQSQATRAENCVRLRWAPDTLAIWDNRCLQHLPLNDYAGERREMHRIILAGEKPLPARGP